MPNLMMDFTKSFVSSFTPSSLSELKSNADEIMDTFMSGAKTAQDTYRKMRSGGGFKKVTDWFFQRGDEFSMASLSENNDDEFDAGTDFGIATEEHHDAKVLDYEGMRDLTKGQVGAMFQIGGKQVEANAMTTSEIISTVNTRSSEILSSLGNINSSLTTIVGKLDQLISLQGGAQRESSGRSRSGIFDSSGNMTIGSVFNYVKDNASMYTSGLSMVSGMLPMLKMMSPGEAAGTLLGAVGDLFLSDKQIFGGKSINDIKQSIDDSVANIQNNLMTRLLSWDKFQGLFGDLTRGMAGRDYSSKIKNQYTTEKALFDGMTRKTIIDVIPSYLRKITQALTGKEFFVSAQGQLTTEQSTGFKEVFRNSLQNPFSSGMIQRMQKRSGNEMDQSDIYLAQRVLMSLYVGTSMQQGINITSDEVFKNGGYPEVNAHAVDLLASKGNKSRQYWSDVINWIIGQMQVDSKARSSFVRTLNTTVRSTDRRFIEYAENTPNVSDVGQLTNDIIDDIVGQYISDTGGKDDRTYRELIKAKVIKRADLPSDIDLDSRASDAVLKKRQIASVQSESSTGIFSSGQFDYVASIFEILNRGINVYSVKRNGPYSKMEPIARQTRTVATDDGTPTVVPVTTSTASGKRPDEVGAASPDTGEAQPPTAGGGETLADMVGQLPQPVQKAFASASGFLAKPLGFIRREFQNMQEDVSNAGASIVDSASGFIDQKRLQYDVSQMGDSEDEKHDQSLVQAILASMQAATADGDTKDDLAALSSQISEIRDPELKSRVQSIVEGTLRRASSKKPAKSKIGQILLWGWGIIKSTIVPFVSKIKNFVVGLGKKFIMPLLRSLKSSGEKIVTGAQSIKEGFMGSDESIGIFGRIKNLGAGIKNIGAGIKSKFGSKKTAQETVSDYVQGSMADGGFVSGESGDVETYSIEEEDKKRKKKEKKPKEKKESKLLKSLSETLKKSEFVQGVTSAWGKRAEDLKPKTMADQATKGILDILKSREGKGEGGGESIFSTIFKKMDSIREVFSTSVQKIDEEQGKKPDGESDDGKKPGTTGDESSTEGSAPALTGGDSSGSGDAAGGEGKKSKGLAFDLGKIFGGFTKILGGIGQAVLTVIAGMSGFKAIMKLIQGILVKSLKPLNRAFQTMYKAMKPIVKQIQSALKDIVQYAVQIVESLIEIMQPILEAIGPIVEQLLEVLTPILNMVTDLVNVLMVPLVAVMQSVVVPLLQGVANTLEILLGVVQVGMGLILSAIGAVIKGVGTLAKFFSHDSSLADTGDQMLTMGKNMMTTGANSVVSGFKKNLTLVGDVVSDVVHGKAVETVHEAAKETAVQNGDTRTPLASAMDGLYGSGDAQGRYSDYLNMKNRGCGPTALADSLSRRSGSSVNAKQVAAVMASSGTYDPNRGTSVGGYINASRAMGVNLTPGGVTARSLRQASPSNPITVIGSGTDFATRSGNNHYMNVIGTSNGQAIVSNPMTGRIERKSIGSIVSHSMLGLYGSGDNDQPYKFSDDVQDALSTLKEMVGQILSIFTGEDESTADKLDAEKAQHEFNNMQLNTSNFTDEEKANIDAEARRLFELDSPRYEGETDKEYEARYQQNMTKYWTAAATSLYAEKMKATAGDPSGLSAYLDEALGSVNPDGSRDGGSMLSWIEGVKSAAAAQNVAGMYNSSGQVIRSGRGFYSDKGVRLFTDEYTPTIYANDASGWDGKNSNYQLILDEFFKNTIGSSVGMTSPYMRYGRPTNKDAVGSTGEYHGGTDFATGGNPYIRATTGGVVSRAGDYNNGYGTMVEIVDAGGDVHIYGHMLANPGAMVKVGDTVEGGQILGKMGNTGDSTGDHLHYEIRTPAGGGDTGHYNRVNPHTFFKWVDGPSADQGKITITDIMNTPGYDFFTPHKSELYNSGYHEQAVAAGLTPAQEAYIAAVGLVENGGKRLTGDDVTLVVNRHFGVSNWKTNLADGEHDTRYGTTLAEQIQHGFIRNYFADNPEHERAWITNNINDYGPALEKVLGYSMQQGVGERWAPYLEEDLLEGTGHGVGNAVVPDAGWPTEMRIPIYAQELGAAARYYNWMIEQGWVNPGGVSQRMLDLWNTTGSYTGSAAGDDVFKRSDQYDAVVDGVPYRYKEESKGWYKVYNKKGELLCSAVLVSALPSSGAGIDQFKKAHKDAVKRRGMITGVGEVELYYYDFQTGTPSGQRMKELANTVYGADISSPVPLISDDITAYSLGTSTVMSQFDIDSLRENLNTTVSPMTGQYGGIKPDDRLSTFFDSSAGKWVLYKGKDFDYSTVPDALKDINPNNLKQVDAYSSDLNGNVAGPVTFVKDAISRLFGSGDVDDGLGTLLDFANENTPIVVNRYAGSSTNVSDHLDAILTNTYNVRSEKIESMLSEMLKLMREKNKQRAARRKTQSASKLPSDEQFPDSNIPSQVERLSVG